MFLVIEEMVFKGKYMPIKYETVSMYHRLKIKDISLLHITDYISIPYNKNIT